ncbi:hypothetical protein BJX99DRAFT_18742 [Aspergillus californicus]
MDYEGNGYRKWIQVAASDNLLLDTILAVTISHYARWQCQASLNDSHIYYRQALKQLQDRLQDPVMVRNESTLAAMMFLISYEVRSRLPRRIVINPPLGIQWLRPVETAPRRCAGLDPGIWIPGSPRPVSENMVQHGQHSSCTKFGDPSGASGRTLAGGVTRPERCRCH